nr:FAD-dependent oxidoreductase [uncultured Carboxylicivirga sp.]
MKNIAVIGAGVSGLSSARLLQEKKYSVTLFESKEAPGGLIRCTIEEGNLFHRVGGHVFNTKVNKVADWFWKHFNKESEFLHSTRKAKIWLNNQYFDYPFENNIYNLAEDQIEAILSDLLEIAQKDQTKPNNFDDFLKTNFGSTLYEIYFKPYNTKIWHTDLTKVPLPWLEGKLPMPNFKDMLLKNITRAAETNMVHSTFNYPAINGSSFIAERLAEGLNIQYNAGISQIKKTESGWEINNQPFDAVIYTGDVRKLSDILSIDDAKVTKASKQLTQLPSNGTSNVLCYTDATDASWIYLPSPDVLPHRIIYTGNFSKANNASERLTCTIEFSGDVDEQTMINELAKLPGKLQPIAFNHEPNSYVIQQHDTRDNIQQLKKALNPHQFYLCGRFAEWEYHNMDKAMESAMNIINTKF